LSAPSVSGRSEPGAVCLGRVRLHDQTVPVLDQGVAHEVELCRLAVALAEQLGVGVGLAFVGVVGALLAMEIAFAIASRSRRIVAAVLGAEALEGGPGFDQRAVDRKVVVRQEAFDFGMLQHRFEELRGDIGIE